MDEPLLPPSSRLLASSSSSKPSYSSVRVASDTSPRMSTAYTSTTPPGHVPSAPDGYTVDLLDLLVPPTLPAGGLRFGCNLAVVAVCVLGLLLPFFLATVVHGALDSVYLAATDPPTTDPRPTYWQPEDFVPLLALALTGLAFAATRGWKARRRDARVDADNDDGGAEHEEQRGRDAEAEREEQRGRDAGLERAPTPALTSNPTPALTPVAPAPTPAPAPESSSTLARAWHAWLTASVRRRAAIAIPPTLLQGTLASGWFAVVLYANAAALSVTAFLAPHAIQTVQQLGSTDNATADLPTPPLCIAAPFSLYPLAPRCTGPALGLVYADNAAAGLFTFAVVGFLVLAGPVPTAQYWAAIQQRLRDLRQRAPEVGRIVDKARNAAAKLGAAAGGAVRWRARHYAFFAASWAIYVGASVVSRFVSVGSAQGVKRQLDDLAAFGTFPASYWLANIADYLAIGCTLALLQTFWMDTDHVFDQIAAQTTWFTHELHDALRVTDGSEAAGDRGREEEREDDDDEDGQPRPRATDIAVRRRRAAVWCEALQFHTASVISYDLDQLFFAFALVAFASFYCIVKTIVKYAGAPSLTVATLESLQSVVLGVYTTLLLLLLFLRIVSIVDQRDRQTYLIERHVYLLRAHVGAYGRREATASLQKTADAEEFIAFLLHLSKFITQHGSSPRMLVLPLSRSVANVLVGYFIAAIVALTSFVVRLAFDGAAA